MEWIGAVSAMLWNLAFVGLIVWVVMRVAGRHRGDGDGVDRAASVRRLFVYGLMFATLVLGAVGATLVLDELARGLQHGFDDDRSALAFGMALVIVAGPAYGLLLRHGRLRLVEQPGERSSFAWAGYIGLSLLVSLVVTAVAAQTLLEGVAGVDDFEAASVAPVAVWGAVWAMHWWWLRASFGAPDDPYLAAGSLTGLITLTIGLGGLAFVAGDEIYTTIVERVPDGHEDPDVRRWLVAASIGAIVWAWHWLARYQLAERTPLWHVYVVVVGALGGLVAAVASAATLGYWTLVWFLGDPEEDLAREHFEYVPAAATAVLVVGLAAWQYHRVVLQRREVERTEPVRTYDYAMAGAGLVAAVVGATLALVALIEAITPEPAGTGTSVANRLILAVVLSLIGAPSWWVFWSRVRRQADADPDGELASIVRRIYLIVLFGVGGIVVLGGMIGVLALGLEDLLDGTFGGETVRSFRVGLSLVVVVTGVAWYHARVFRSDRDAVGPVEVLPAPLPRHVVLISPRGSTIPDQLAAATGVELERWYRTDEIAMPEVDIEALVAEIEASEARDLLVVVGPTGTTLTPFET